MTSRGAEATSGDDLVLPERTVVLHIGPPKTGTSTLQGAFHAARAATLAQGVRYVGRSRHSGTGVLAVTGRPSFRRDSGPPPMRAWHELVREIRSAGEPRLLLSSEFLADAEPDAIARIVGDLEPARLRIVVTLRPLVAILPSQWQQYVQSFMPLSYDDWLEGVFNGPRGTVTPTFWRRHRHDELIDRWAEAVGADHVTAVVVDEADHDQVLRTFERLLGLRLGTLVADADLANRSLTLPEVEAVRAFNVAFREAELGNALYHRVMHFGAAAFMKMRPVPADEPRIETPPWAVERAADVEREMVDRIAGRGIRVVGDLESLVPKPFRTRHVGLRRGACVSAEVSARMSMGIVVIAGLARRGPVSIGSLDRFASYKLAGALVARTGSAALRTLSRLLRVPASLLTARTGRPFGNGERPLDEAEAWGLLTLASTLQQSGLSRDALERLVQSVETQLGRWPPSDQVANAVNPDCLPPTVAASMAMSTLVATGIVTSELRQVRWAWVEPPEVAVVSSPRLARLLVGRVLQVLAPRRAAIAGRGRRK